MGCRSPPPTCDTPGTRRPTPPAFGNRTGFEQIASVDDSDPKTAVITFKQPYAAWFNPFGTLQSIFPKHLLEGKDRTAEMRDGIQLERRTMEARPVGEGPGDQLRAESELLGQEAPPRRPGLQDHPRCRRRAGRITESARCRCSKACPPRSPWQSSKPSRHHRRVDRALLSTCSNLNTQKAPLDSVAVRQALAYATDREPWSVTRSGSSSQTSSRSSRSDDAGTRPLVR